MCTCPVYVTELAELCEECQQQLQEDAPVPIEVEDVPQNWDWEDV
jgi:hypothetical protein